MTPYYEDDWATIYHGDCREVLPLVLDDVEAVIVTDPPYGTGGWRRTASGQGGTPWGSSVREAWDDGDLGWLLPIPTLTFWSTNHLTRLLVTASDIGLTKHRALHMHKKDPMPSQTGVTQYAVEQMWVLSDPGFHLRGGTDWFSCSTPRSGRDADATGHPYQKPIAFMAWCLAKLPADLAVVDPFMGSGTTLVAAKALNRRAIGVEQSEAYCEIAATRLAQEVLDFGGVA